MKLSKIFSLAFSLCIILSLAAAAEIVTAEGITLKYVIPFGASTASIEGGGIKMMNLGGQPVIGTSEGGGVTGKWGAGYVLWEGGGAGQWVPLFISRNPNNTDINITWEASKYPSVNLFYEPGDGTGQYTHGPNGYLTLASGVVGGSYTHVNQIGTGFAEIYYKGFQTAIPTPDDYLSAEAVAKVNITIIKNGGLKLMGLPLYAGKVSNTIPGQLTAGQQLLLFPRTGGGLDYVSVTSGGVVGSDFNTDPMTGFWLKNPGVNDVTITFVGSLAASAFEKDLAQLDLTSNPLPSPITSANLGVDGDVINPQSGLGLDYYEKVGGSWGPNFATLNFNQGFWYKYSANNRKWQVNLKTFDGRIIQY